MKGRTDLRDVPLVTIDPVDARDHDDAVYAEPDTDAKNPGGWIVLVAIADVAHYVRPGSRLDREAQLRGNSVYFPDRVVPMLPEKISNDLCSLREGEERACLVVRMIYRRARRQAQPQLHARDDALGGKAQLSGGAGGHRRRSVGEVPQPLMEGALKPLWAAYARCKRRVTAVSRSTSTCPSARSCSTRRAVSPASSFPSDWTAHQLIEEMMIQANVAAAESAGTQEGRRRLPRPRRAVEGEAQRRCASSSRRSTSNCRRRAR